jgi:hypothetical protein
LKNKQLEIQIPIAKATRGEELAIQYPGKESQRETTSNPWDFRPKWLGHEDSDLTFEELWKPLFDDVGAISDPETRKHTASIIATIYYRMAYLVDYVERPAGTYPVTRLWIVDRRVEKREEQEMKMGPVWLYNPPVKAVKEVSSVIPNWADLSFEAFLQYNSLLAWNEDLKLRAREDLKVQDPTKKPTKKWSATDPRGRINTLRTYIRVIGYIIGEVTASTVFGGFMRKRGMSTATDREILRICEPYVTDEDGQTKL